jgi:hypothetical protein
MYSFEIFRKIAFIFLISFMRAICHVDHILLNIISQMKLDEERKLQSFSYNSTVLVQLVSRDKLFKFHAWVPSTNTDCTDK